MTQFKKRPHSRRFPWHYFLFASIISSCAENCTKPCGTFTYNHLQIDDQASSNGIEMTLDFDFNPSDCGAACACNRVCYIQIVRAVNQEDGSYLYASSEKEERATAEGWYIDRVPGKIWGYYGRNDDGSFGGNLTPGTDATNAQLYDFPRRSEVEPWIGFTWSAVSVPACIENAASTCNNKLLGFYAWNWIVEDDGSVVAPLNWNAAKGLKDQVDLAVSEWNIQAPGLGKNVFPAFTRLSE